MAPGTTVAPVTTVTPGTTVAPGTTVTPGTTVSPGGEEGPPPPRVPTTYHRTMLLSALPSDLREEYVEFCIEKPFKNAQLGVNDATTQVLRLMEHPVVCPHCKYGPISIHLGCERMTDHHLEPRCNGRTTRPQWFNNACPGCGHLPTKAKKKEESDLSGSYWEKWDGSTQNLTFDESKVVKAKKDDGFFRRVIRDDERHHRHRMARHGDPEFRHNPEFFEHFMERMDHRDPKRELFTRIISYLKDHRDHVRRDQPSGHASTHSIWDPIGGCPACC